MIRIDIAVRQTLQVRAQTGEQLFERLPVAALGTPQQIMQLWGLQHAPYYETENARSRGKYSGLFCDATP